jgi:uncharacterized protein YabE (DUF348 family)
MPDRNISAQRGILNHWFIGILCLLAAIIGICWYVIALDRVTLQVDGREFRMKTLSSTVARVLQEKDVSLGEGDQITPALPTKVYEGLVIRVERAFPVRIKADGRYLVYHTIPRTVREVLERAQVQYDADDKIVPVLEQTVQPNQEIQVIRILSKIVKVQSAIKPGTEYRRDLRLERGVKKVVKEGRAGLLESEYRQIYEDGKLKKQIKLSQKVLRPMTNTLIALGAKRIVGTLVTSRGSYRYVEVKTMNASAYSPGPESCGKYAVSGRTYTGKKAGFGIVAVDRRVIPLGTMLYIEGYGKAEAADIGGAIKGNRIDLCFETYREAVMFGRRKVKVYVLEGKCKYTGY